MRYAATARLPGVFALALLWASASPAQPSFTGVGDLPGGASASAAWAVSGDGQVVVGESEGASGTEAFRWTPASGISGLGFLSGADPFSTARAVSDDGSVIAGSSNDASGVQRAYRWTSGAMTALAGQICANCDPLTEGLGISGDGLVVVGSSLGRGLGDAHLDPVRWPGGGTALVDLGNLPASVQVGQAFGASQTGSIISGVHQSTGGKDAWYWTGSGLNVLPRLSSTTPVVATAYAVSPDGSTIVGTSTKRTLTLPGGTVVAVEPQAVRWTGANYATLENLGGLPGATSIDSVANATSPDGEVVVGRARAADGADHAFIWDTENGMRDFRDVLTTVHGLDLTGWQLSEARGISYAVDGVYTVATVVGEGIDPGGHPQGWVAVVPVPEPSRRWLLVAGLAALAALGPRRAR